MKHREFRPLLKEGVNRPFVAVEGQAAVDSLTSVRFQDTVLVDLGKIEKYTKVFIAPYDKELDPKLLLTSDVNVVWAKRHVINKQEKASVVALMTGVVPDRIWVPGNGWRRVRKYVELPPMCFNCCRYGHKAWRCRYDTVCRFCSGKHGSKDCAAKIQEGVVIPPKCCNCGQAHNAGSTRCAKRPSLMSAVKVIPNEAPRQIVPAHPPERNAWFPALSDQDEASAVAVSVPASRDIPKCTTRPHKQAADDGLQPILKYWTPRRAGGRDVAGAAAASEEAAPPSPPVKSPKHQAVLPSLRQRDVADDVEDNDALRCLVVCVTRLEADNRRLQERLRKLEERQGDVATRQASTTENGAVGGLVNPKERITSLIGMLTEFLAKKAVLLDDEMQGSDLRKVIREIVQRWKQA
ncbi:hypothetical protein GWK47_048433 [Chionoecetes opilio]|uniref:Gag-like protein n=1 Tax=Chionoecetes opilio TaxID=41210 RepID=A0A8J5CTV9_CHIOP|nr:hypothetical protein GWK47_048433 [Chionoecetes opilio]